jgi:hypothetical protein
MAALWPSSEWLVGYRKRGVATRQSLGINLSLKSWKVEDVIEVFITYACHSERKPLFCTINMHPSKIIKRERMAPFRRVT